MSKITYEELEEVINDSQADVRVQTYSGRGMYGKECLGFTTNDPIGATAEIVGNIAEEDLRDRVVVAFQNTRQDSMGHETIIYFPGVKPELTEDLSQSPD